MGTHRLKHFQQQLAGIWSDDFEFAGFSMVLHFGNIPVPQASDFPLA
jgi:hypothetical protein